MCDFCEQKASLILDSVLPSHNDKAEAKISGSSILEIDNKESKLMSFINIDYCPICGRKF